MNVLVDLLQFAGFGALVLTVWSALSAFYRRRDTRRLDIMLAVGGLALASPLGAAAMRGRLAILPVAFLVLFPYLLLRLVQHFREVPKAAMWTALAAPFVAVLVAGVTPPPWPPWQQYLVSAYALAALTAIAGAFSLGASRSSGVSRRRLIFAGVGTWAFVAVYALSTGASVAAVHQQSLAQANRALSGLALIAYYLAFATPRRLRKSWQRQEVGRYLVDTADREADERGRHAADDVLRAAMRGAAGSAAFVAIRDSVTSEDVTIRASTQPMLEGLALEAESGPADVAFREAVPAVVPLAALEAHVKEGLKRTGTSVLLAPISSSMRRWGVVGVVQRHGSLFPDDDLQVLAQLGQYCSGILDHGQLVTEARERGRRAADRRLREVESRMALMLDTIRDYAILIVDHRGTVVNWPVGAQAVFGYAADEVVDRSAARLFGMAEADWLDTLAEAERTGRVAREHEGARPDGSRFIALTHVRRLAPGPDDLRGFVVVTRDVTERRALEERLRQGQKMEALGRLAGGIAHDFNNLLTVILGFADWIDAELPPDDTRRREPVAEIQKAATRAAGLTRQLLAFSRHQVVQPVVLDVGQTLDELMPMLRPLIGEQVEITVETVGDLPPVLADRNQLEQVIINLAVNARDAMPGGGRLRIRATVEHLDPAPAGSGLTDGDWVRLDVQDTGVGMDAATQARIFEPFFTTKEFGRGTGLGLATVYGILRQMGGVVTVTSAPGQGSTFHVYMRPTKLLAVESGVVAEAAAPGGSETILLVEDEPGVAKLLEQMLHRHGYRLLVADGPARALELAGATDRIDMIISDVVMPGGNGPDLVRSLRKERPGLRALFISGYADTVLSSEGLPPGAHFLQKPFSGIDLLMRVRQVLTGIDRQ